LANNKLAEAFIEIAPDFGGFTSKLVEGFDFAFGSAAVSISSSFDAAGRALFKKFSIPLAVATAANIAQFQALEREINTVMTLFGTSGLTAVDTFSEMSQGVREVAREVGGLEKDIAGGLYQAISAGVPRDSVFEFLDVAQMAAMADKAADLTVAVDGISTGVNAFAAEELSAAEASDIMFATVAAGKTTFAELGSSIGRAAGLAANAGVEFTEFNAIIAEMTKSGIATSEAVSYMRAALTSLLRPSEDMNAIFREIGFETAEAAVPVIGLQASLQALVDATGGSTTELQELLGSAEAVSTTLAVTGDKADSFEATLRKLENSAGATEKAYDLMQRGIGRSFGRLTEGFDQLGNIFGEMGAAIVKPVVDVLADLVSGLGEIFEDMIPMAQTLGGAMKGLMSVFDIPLIGGFAKGLLAAGIAMSGLLGVLGLILVPLGKFIYLMFSLKIMGRIAPLMETLGLKLLYLNDAMLTSIKSGGIFGKMLGGLRTGVAKLGGAMLTTSGAIAVSFGALAVAGVAIWGIVKAFTAVREASEEAAKQNDIFGYGVVSALEAAGIAVQDFSPAFEDTTRSAIETRTEFNALLQEVRELKTEVGSVGASDLLLNIGVSMVWQGATPEEAYALMQEISKSEGLTFPVNMEGFENALTDVTALDDGLDVLVEKAKIDWKSFGILPDWMKSDTLKKSTTDVTGLGKALGQMYTQAAKNEQLPEFIDILGDLEGDIDNAALFGLVIDSMVASVEEINDIDLDMGAGYGTFDATSQQFIDRMMEMGIIVNELEDDFEGISLSEAIDPGLVADEFKEVGNVAAAALNQLPAKINGMNVLYGEQGAILRQLKTDTDGVFAAAVEGINNAKTAIVSSLEAQIPLFGGYTAAVELTKEALRTSADAWQTDVDLIASRTQVLQDNLTQEELDIFNQKGVAEQAAFLMGDLDNVIEKLGIFKETAASMDELGEIKIDEAMGTIMADAQTAIDEGITALVTSAGEAGTAVSAAYIDSFESANGATTWGPSAQTYMDEVEGVIGAEIAGPTISAPTFVGGSTTYTVNVSATTSKNPGQAVSRALQYVNEHNR